MLNAPSFSEDMLPRHFPTTKAQSEQKPAVAPLPTLPGLSLLLDDEYKVSKSEPVRKVEPKKSFEQWKQQHQAIFLENAHPRKPDKKQVRFEADNPNQRQSSPVSPNLELSYHEASQGENFCQSQHHSNKTEQFDDYAKNVLLPRCNYKPMNAAFPTESSCNAASQRTVELTQFSHRPVRSESMKDNYVSSSNQPARNNDHRQCNRNCCQTNNWEMMNYPTCNHGMQPTGCGNQRQVHQSHQHEMQPKTFSPCSTHVERNAKEQLTDDTLLSIMEEQQQHILLQQSQIMMQQKQNMMQQKQIFMLQHQVQQLLLRNGNSNESPQKLCQTSICDKPAPAPMPLPNALQNAIKTRTSAIDSLMRNGTTTRSSIGVMTSFLGGNDGTAPNGMQQFNDHRLATKVTNEKFIENMGGGEYSYKDSMLDKINEAIKNSPAMIDYRRNGTADGCASPSRQSDMNVATQALFYEASSTNNGYGATEPKTSDRSFALYMLGMKYDCAPDDTPKNMDKRDWQSTQTNGNSDQVSVNLSPEIYDYLKRHGLLRQE